MKQTSRQIAVQSKAKFNRYTVTGFALRSSYVKVECDCGTVREVQLSHLKMGLIKSCGCYCRDRAAKPRTHGGARNKGTPEYKTWGHIKTRCLNPNNKKYSNYGGRGIKICDQWLNSFEAFLLDMGPRPSPRHTIDRIDVNGDYEPSNCRWATTLEQSYNKTSSVKVEVNGTLMCLAEARRERGIGRGTFEARLYKRGWTAEQALELCPPPAKAKRTTAKAVQP